MNTFLKSALVRPPFLLAQTDGLQILILVDIGFMDDYGSLVLFHRHLKANALTHRPPCNPIANHKKLMFTGLSYVSRIFYGIFAKLRPRAFLKVLILLKSNKDHHIREITRNSH